MSIIKSFSVGDGDMFYIDHNSDNFSIIDCCMDDGNKEAITQEIKDKISKKGIIRFKLSNTGNQENLNADIIKTYQVPWAPDEEQERISTILTTQDKVIELKEKQLTGKQRQKKYLMQQLLTGKKRLPGFAFEVEKTNIKAISTYSVYYINLPSVNHMDYASFTLHFEDTTQRKWRVPGRAEFKSGTWELSWEKPQKI